MHSGFLCLSTKTRNVRQMKISLPYPDSRLSPNAREDRRKIAPVRAKARRDGYYACIGSGAHKLRSQPSVALKITFHPPDNCTRDLDNAYASIKSHLDGLADAMKRDDSTFHPVILDWGDKVKNGAVVVTLGAMFENSFCELRGSVP